MKLNQTLNGTGSIAGLYPSGMTGSNSTRVATRSAFRWLRRSSRRQRIGSHFPIGKAQENGVWEELVFVVLGFSGIAGLLLALLALM